MAFASLLSAGDSSTPITKGPPSPRRTGDQSQRPTRQVEWEDLVTIDAFEPETVRAVRAAREQVRLTFEQMQDFW